MLEFFDDNGYICIVGNFAYLLYRALLIPWPFCLRWCKSRKSLANIRVLLSQ